MSKPRVLVVENDIEWRTEHCEMVEELGYEAIVAEGQGDSLIEDALNKNLVYRCHTAIVDMRVRNNSDHSDLSGIDEVALKLGPTSVIMVSAFLDVDPNSKSEQARDKGIFLSYASKSSPPQKRLDMLEKSVFQASSDARGLEIADEDGLLGQFGIDCSDEIRDVLGRLFSDQKSGLILKPALKAAVSSFQTDSNPESVKLLIWVTPQGGRAQLVKIAPIEKVRTEIQCCELLFGRRHLARYLTRISSSWLAWRLGGIAYDLGRQRSLAEIYQSTEMDSEGAVLRGLEWFYKQTLSRLRGLSAPDDLNQSLLSLYLGDNQLFPPRPKFDDDRINNTLVSLTDPSIWIKENLSSIQDDKEDRSYGDMRLERILIDTDRWMTLLTGDDLQGPMGLLKSSAALELDLLLNAIPTNEVDTLRLFLNLAISIAEPNEIIQPHYDILPTKDCQYNHFTRKAIRIVSHLRRLAFSNMPSIVTQEDYLIRLLLECGSRLLLREDESQNRDRAWQLHLLASILTVRLDLSAIRGLAWLKNSSPFTIKLFNQSDMMKWIDEVQKLQQELEFLRREGRGIENPRTQQLSDALTHYGVQA